MARGELCPTLGCTFGTARDDGSFHRGLTCSPGWLTPLGLAGDAGDVGEEWSEREEWSGSGQFPPKGHHLAPSLVPDTFINRIEAIP